LPSLPTLIFVLLAAAMAGLWMYARTQRNRMAEELLREKRQNLALRSSLELLNEGVVLLGQRKQVLYANPAAATLLDAEPVLLPSEILFPAFTRHQVLLGLVKRTSSEETLRQSLEFGQDEEQPRSVEVTLAPLGGGRRLLVLQDIRVGALVDKRRRDFVANASHELKTPIAAILGMLDLVDVVEEDKREELLERARKNAVSLANLTDDLLRLARADDPDWKPAPSLLDLDSVLQEVADNLRERVEEKGLTLELVTDPACSELIADHFSLFTVIQNLVLNAVIYTREGSVLVKSFSPSQGVMAISVCDTGPGIDPEALPHIFERFFRGDVAHSRASGGTGLGLAIVRNLLRRMGGRISVRSEPGVGSEFIVELPTNPTRSLPAG
jgi:two-component system phosphate regulon sensor histidine kinase PhoR